MIILERARVYGPYISFHFLSHSLLTTSKYQGGSWNIWKGKSVSPTRFRTVGLRVLGFRILFVARAMRAGQCALALSQEQLGLSAFGQVMHT